MTSARAKRTMDVNTAESSEGSREPRICMPTFSAFAGHVFRSGLYEAQDVLADCDDVDLIHLEASKRLAFGEKVLRRLVYHDVSRKLVSLNPGIRPVRLTRYYDLFLVVCPHVRDVWYANAIQGWRDHCRTSICWVDEVYVPNLPWLEYWLPILSRFDYVIVGIGGSGKALSDAIGRPSKEIQGGVDTIRFSPYPDPPARVIDVYSIGRRCEGVHRRLLESAAKKIFYIHDTLDAANSETWDYAQHRDLYANIAKRSRFFMVAPAKLNSPEQTQGQAALGFRYFEGSAAGAVLVGQTPDCEAFRCHFDWPQAIIEIQPDGSDAVEVISRLLAEPERLREISCQNAEQALWRHDWVYRWKEILGFAGLKPTPAMEAREKRLKELAELARESSRHDLESGAILTANPAKLLQHSVTKGGAPHEHG